MFLFPPPQSAHAHLVSSDHKNAGITGVSGIDKAGRSRSASADTVKRAADFISGNCLVLYFAVTNGFWRDAEFGSSRVWERAPLHPAGTQNNVAEAGVSDDHVYLAEESISSVLGHPFTRILLRTYFLPDHVLAASNPWSPWCTVEVPVMLI